MYAFIYACIYVCMCIIYMYMYVYMYIMYICVYICVYIHIYGRALVCSLSLTHSNPLKKKGESEGWKGGGLRLKRNARFHYFTFLQMPEGNSRCVSLIQVSSFLNSWIHQLSRQIEALASRPDWDGERTDCCN